MSNDDDVAIDEAWMDETYGKRVNTWADWRCGDFCIAYCFGWHLNRKHPLVNINNIATRGQLRRLIDACQDLIGG